jgi:hypothetical protein
MTYGQKVEQYATLQNELYQAQLAVARIREHGTRVACSAIVAECDAVIERLAGIRNRLTERGIR